MRAHDVKQCDERVWRGLGTQVPRSQRSRDSHSRGAGGPIADAVIEALGAVRSGHVDELWNDPAMLSRQVDLLVPSGDAALFVVVLAVGDRPESHTSTFANGGFLNALAGAGRTDFGPSDFSPHRALWGYLAVSVQACRLDIVQQSAEQAMASSDGVARVKAVGIEGIYSVGPRLATVRPVREPSLEESLPLWRRVQRSSSIAS